MKRFACAMFFTGFFIGISHAGASDETFSPLNLPSERAGAFSSWSVDEERKMPGVVFPIGFKLDNVRRVSPYFIACVLIVQFGDVFLPDQVEVFMTDTLSDREKFKVNRDYQILGGEVNISAKFPRVVGIKYTLRF